MNFKLLRPIKKDFKFKKYAVVDCETWGLGGKLAFGVVMLSKKEWYKFKTKEEFYKIVKDQKIELVYAHNLEFDFIKIRDKSALEGTKNPLFAGGLLIGVECERGLNWRDSYALLKSNLDGLGKALGKSKGFTPQKFISPPDKDYRTISIKDVKYCVRDCLICLEMLEKLFDLTGCQKYTIASTCMYYFRSKHLKDTIRISKLHKKFKESYFGGRTEAFKIGKVKAKVIDVNSLYPFVMRKCNFPNPATLITKKFDFKTSYLILMKYEGCAKVKVEHHNSKIGLLPLKMNNKLCFPTGVFEGTFNFNELRFFIKHGGKIKKFYEMTYSTTKIENPFISYVDELYNLKSKSEGAEKLIYKFLLNTLYGKFGENKHTNRIYFQSKEMREILQKHGKKKYKIVQLKRGNYYIDIDANHSKEPIHQCFVFCSYITSEARIYLNEYLLKNRENLVYCDTDSMALEGTIMQKVGGGLGEWSYEDYQINKVYGNKFYMTDKGLKLKGVPKSSKIKGKTFHFTSLVKSKESLRRDLKAGSVENRTKIINFTYDKRDKKQDGTTKALRLLKEIG